MASRFVDPGTGALAAATRTGTGTTCSVPLGARDGVMLLLIAVAFLPPPLQVVGMATLTALAWFLAPTTEVREVEAAEADAERLFFPPEGAACPDSTHDTDSLPLFL